MKMEYFYLVVQISTIPLMCQIYQAHRLRIKNVLNLYNFSVFLILFITRIYGLNLDHLHIFSYHIMKVTDCDILDCDICNSIFIF